MLHEALRQVLGDHVAQKGSMVAPDRLRFDFSHPKPINEQELAKVEAIANRVVLQNEPVVTRLMGVDEAIKSGARALFGEKYGDEVARGVDWHPTAAATMPARPIRWNCAAVPMPVPLAISALSTIVAEGAVAAGVRRLEAMTGDAAREYLAGESRKLQEAASLLKVTPNDVPVRLAAILDERRKMERELADARPPVWRWAAAIPALRMMCRRSPALNFSSVSCRSR